jgi:hypothetical protein
MTKWKLGMLAVAVALTAACGEPLTAPGLSAPDGARKEGGWMGNGAIVAPPDTTSPPSP